MWLGAVRMRQGNPAMVSRYGLNRLRSIYTTIEEPIHVIHYSQTIAIVPRTTYIRSEIIAPIAPSVCMRFSNILVYIYIYRP